MKTTFLATILFASFALTSCSEAPSTAADYVKNNPVSGDAQGATPEAEPAPDPAPASTPPAKPTPTTPEATKPAAPGTPPPAMTPPPAVTGLTYSNLNAKVFAPYCIGCHGTMGNLNLESYAKVKSFASAVKTRAITKADMPPGAAMPAELQKLLGDWIAAGTPEK